MNTKERSTLFKKHKKEIILKFLHKDVSDCHFTIYRNDKNFKITGITTQDKEETLKFPYKDPEDDYGFLYVDLAPFGVLGVFVIIQYFKKDSKREPVFDVLAPNTVKEIIVREAEEA